jgi:hypothetical protein
MTQTELCRRHCDRDHRGLSVIIATPVDTIFQDLVIVGRSPVLLQALLTLRTFTGSTIVPLMVGRCSVRYMCEA